MKISIVTDQLVGSTKTGERGIAAAELAALLARGGHDVAVIFTGEGRIDYAHRSIRRLLGAGVRITWIEIHRQPVYPKYLRETSSAFEYLRSADADLFIFHGANGPAFSCVNARNAAIAFPHTQIAVIAREPTAWLCDTRHSPVREIDTLAYIHMERSVFEGADHVVCSSDTIVAWLASQSILPRSLIRLPFRIGGDADFADQQIKDVVESDAATRWIEWIESRARDLASAPAGAPHIRAVAGSSRIGDEHGSLSIVVTHYERPTLVNQTLASLSMQTNTSFDVVLVDDGSRSIEAVRNLDAISKTSWPFPLRVIRQNNAYLGAARNAGIRASESEFVIFMDDDNIAFPEMVDVFLTAQKSSQADIVTSQMQIFRDPIEGPDLGLVRDGERWCFTGGPTELGLSINCFGDATGIYRRDVFAKVGCFHEWHGVGHEDWHLHARASIAGLKHVSLPVPLYWYRRVEGSMLHSTDRYENNRIIWQAYRDAMPGHLGRCVDLAIRNDL